VSKRVRLRGCAGGTALAAPLPPLHPWPLLAVRCGAAAAASHGGVSTAVTAPNFPKCRSAGGACGHIPGLSPIGAGQRSRGGSPPGPALRHPQRTHRPNRITGRWATGLRCARSQAAGRAAGGLERWACVSPIPAPAMLRRGAGRRQGAGRHSACALRPPRRPAGGWPDGRQGWRGGAVATSFQRAVVIVRHGLTTPKVCSTP
jgi:hypothetical protein